MAKQKIEEKVYLITVKEKKSNNVLAAANTYMPVFTLEKLRKDIDDHGSVFDWVYDVFSLELGLEDLKDWQILAFDLTQGKPVTVETLIKIN